MIVRPSGLSKDFVSPVPLGVVPLDRMVTAMSVAIWLKHRSERAASTRKGLRFAHGSGARFGEELCSVIVRGVMKANIEK